MLQIKTQLTSLLLDFNNSIILEYGTGVVPICNVKAEAALTITLPYTYSSYYSVTYMLYWANNYAIVTPCISNKSRSSFTAYTWNWGTTSVASRSFWWICVGF